MLKKIIYLLFVLFLIPIFILAQSKKIDSLKLALKKANHDTAKLVTLNNIAKEFEITLPDSSLNYYAKAIEFGEKIKVNYNKTSEEYKTLYLSYGFSFHRTGVIFQNKSNYSLALNFYNKALKIRKEISDKKGISATVNNIGIIYYEKGDLIKALKNYQNSLKIREEINDKSGISVSLFNIGNVYKEMGNISKALEYYTRTLKNDEELGDKKGVAQTLSNLGVIYYNMGDISKALEYYNKSLKIVEELSDKHEISISLNNIGVLYKSQGDVTKALEYYNKSLKIEEELNDVHGISTALNNIGVIYFYELANPSKAMDYYLKSLKICEKFGFKHGIANAFNNIGDIYNSQGNHTQALNYFNSSLKLRQEIEDKKGVISSLNNIAHVYFQLKKYTYALEKINQSMLIAKKLGFPEEIKNTASILFEVHKKLGNYQLALHSYVLFIQMRDSINNIETQKATIKQQTKYEFDKQQILEQEKHDAELRIQKEKADSDKKRQSIIILSVTIMLLIVGIFSILLFNRFKKTQQQKKIIIEQKQKVEIQKDVVEEQNHLIKVKQKEILDSIHYAKRLQEAILPPLKFIDEHVPNNFVLYQPKDVVAGDFYWAESKDNKFFIAAADCTGHGVPGAMVSVVCSNALNRTVNEFGITDIGKILDKTRELVLETFAKGNAEVKDGMDISLLCIDKQNNKAFWSGANNPLWYVKLPGTEVNTSGTEVLEVPVINVTSSEVEKSTDAGLDFARPDIQLIEIKADKQPIGKTDYAKPFTTHEIALQEGMLFYLFTDGYADQFGGPKGKKFKYKQLEELLLANASKSMNEQHEILTQQFVLWKGDLEQVDDVCVIGVRV